jgi:choline dehydrogenase
VTDIVVVGGGTAGCIVASRLAERGALVTVVEAGPDPGPLAWGRWPAELLDASSIPTTHDWGYVGQGAKGQPLVFERAKVIGGCSAHNGSTHSIGWRNDWAEDGLDPDAIAAGAASVIGHMGVRVPDDDELQPFQRAFLDACISTDLPRTDDLCDIDGGLGVSVSPVNIVDGRRTNTAIAYLDGVRDRITVARAEVDAVVLSRGATRGVRLAGGEVIDADTVVLCAGAYGTPAVLHRSGVGPSALLTSLGIEVALDLPVGVGLQDQPVVVIEVAATAELAARMAAHEGFLPDEQCVAKLAAGTVKNGAPYDHHVFPWTERRGDGWVCVFAVGLLRPRSRGDVSVTSPDPTVALRIDHRYLHDPADLTDLAAGVRAMARIIESPCFDGLLVDRPALPDAEWVASHHSHYWHPTSSAAIGTVLDDRCAVHGIDGLHVVDASALPSVPRATTALPVCALAEWWTARA